MLTLIAAVAKNGVIGNDNGIPWHLPEDFAHFKELTSGHTVVMGANTWLSLPEKFRPLPNRLNIIISKKMAGERDRPGFRTFDNIRDGLQFAQSAFANARTAEAHKKMMIESEVTVLPTGEDIFIIGGASIYKQTMHLANRLVISEVDLEPEGDTHFPDIGEEWNEVSREPRKGFDIVVYERA